MHGGWARLIALLGLLADPSALADTRQGWVIHVADGDTVVVWDEAGHERMVRLAGIDAPEKDQPHGHAAHMALTHLVLGMDVRYEPYKRDRFGRWIGRVQVCGEDVGLRLIRLGLAWHYGRYAHEQPPEQRRAYAEAQARARAARLGLWSQADPVPPWAWRARHGP
ncbi:MAG: thermonuclease family protein [Thiobacillaceae bacterium]|nr:thermonuclease family protein [Thiobacillaceae bacterium]MCX7673147.1 thermonuclease family protein [Thiobacillaceae bacterium]